MASSKVDRRNRNHQRRVGEFISSVRWIKKNEELVLKLWLENIEEPLGGQTSTINLQTLREDLDSILVLLTTDVRDSGKIFESISEHLQTACVSSLYSRLSYLEDAVVEALMKSESTTREMLHLFAELRARFRNMLTVLLQHNADPYEQLSRFAGSAFCRLDTQGTILYANKPFYHLLERTEAVGEKLASFFLEASRKELKARLQQKADKVVTIDNLTVNSQSEPYPVVRATLIPVTVCGVIGQYIVNLSRISLEYQRLFKGCPTGLFTVNLEGKCTYSNHSAARIWGVSSLVDRTLSELFPDETEKIEEQRTNRFTHKRANEYPIEARHLKDPRRTFPVEVAAMPEIRENGEIVGAIALVRETTTEQVSRKITSFFAELPDATHILGSVAIEIDKVVPLDRCSVIMYSKGRKHCRLIHLFERTVKPTVWPVRWFEMTAGMQEFIARQEIEAFGDIREYLKREDWQDPRNPMSPKDWRRMHRSFIRVPLVEDDQVVASMSITRKGPNAFDSSDVETIKALPLLEVLRVVMHLERRRNLEFRIDLMREIFQHWREQTRVASVIVKKIRENYGWSNVSFFHIDEKSDTICLLEQDAPDPANEFPKGYRQDQKSGVLGWVYHHRQAAIISDLEKDPVFKEIALRITPEVRSELCLPVLANGKVCWLLNIEDVRRNAFVDEEIEELSVIMKEVTNLLEGVLMRHFVDVTLENTSDAVIVIEADGVISKTNDATARLTGEIRDSLLGKHLSDILAPNVPNNARVLLQIVGRERISCAEMTLQNSDGTRCEVLASASPLPEELGGSVIVAKDLTLLERVKQLEFSASLYNELAIQTKTPLALAASWIASIKRDDASYADTCDKVLAQLKKVDLPFDRLALYHVKDELLPYNPLLLDVEELLWEIREEFPANEQEKIALTEPLPDGHIEGDLFQLNFCIRSILSYLLRFVSETRKITIVARTGDERVEIAIQGYLPLTTCEQLAQARENAEAAIHIGLGEPLMEKILFRHKGTLTKSQYEERVEFTLRLPLQPASA